MMSHGWPIVVRGGLLDPRGYPPLYALMIASHRLLRYATPLLHLLRRDRDAGAARPRRASTRRPRPRRRRCSPARRPASRVRARPLLVARYYVLTTAALAAGLYDWLRHGTEAGWEAPEGTR